MENETSQEFLKRIGPRELTHAEARHMHLLRLKEGHPGNTGFVEFLVKADLSKPGNIRLADVATSDTWPCPDEPERCETIGSKMEAVKFNERTTFWDVEGIPVTLNGPEGVPYSAAWDTTPPRKFDPDSLRRNGAQISQEQFEELVGSFQPRPPAGG